VRLRPEQLAARLGQDLPPVCLVSGDEPFQLEEAAASVREAAKAAGHTSREVFWAETGFDWPRLAGAADSLSLFAEKRLVELRLPSGKPGAEGGKVLAAWSENPPPDTLLLIIAGKLDKAQQNTKWFKAVDKAGVVVQVWPVEAAALPAWIARRMQARGMQPTPEAVALLAERVEGNLLAADQELEKLRLLTGGGPVDADQVAAAVSDSARYDVFGLVDAALAGDAARAARMLFGLRGEGVAANLVLWALTRELRALAAMSRALAAGQPQAAVFKAHRVWDKRKGPVQAALRRHPARRWQALLWQAGELERVVKGQAPGSPWEELLQLTLKIAGRPLFRAAG